MYASRDSEAHAEGNSGVTEDDIRGYLIEINVIRDSDSIESHESLFERGLVDSLGIAILINQLENKTRITVPEQDLLPDNFDSINAITAYVNSRLEAKRRD